MPRQPAHTAEEKAPEGLRPFLFHGMEFTERTGRPWAECLFCGKDKFSVNVETTQWDCKVCGMRGNAMEFVRQLHDIAEKGTHADKYDALQAERGLLTPEPLYAFGAAWNALNNEWVVPGYLKDKRLGNLYAWRGAKGKRRLFATPAGDPNAPLRHCLMGLGDWDSSKPNVYICEGPWDAMALWEMLRCVKWADEKEGGKLAFTGNPASSLGAAANIIAAPGCNVWYEGWASLFAGKRVFFLYDNDHPVKHPQTGNLQPPGAWAGMQRAVEILAAAEDRPSSVHVIHWGNHTTEQQHNPGMPSGFDVRDHLSATGTIDTLQGRIPRLAALLDMLKLVPDDWVAGRSAKNRKGGGLELKPLKCESWKTLHMAWRKAMKWTPGLDRALVFMLACAASTDLPEEQLWGKVVGPPSCGKSTLCEAISVCKKHVVAKSTMRGFHSGYKSDKEGEEDNSLLALLRSKTLVTKDGDTLLQSPNLGQILSEARDIYDRVSRTHYRHGMNRDYENFNMTWLLCGTSSLRSLDQSELGQRFLDCVIMEDIDADHEREINLRKSGSFRMNMAKLATMNGAAAMFEAEAMTTAKRLTGGYLEYLRDNINEMVGHMQFTDKAADACIAYGTFVAILRARPSSKQKEEVSRELSTRLVTQFHKLAYCTAAVMSKDKVDGEVLERVRQVALDTARGVTMNVLRAVMGNEKGLPTSGIAVVVNETEDSTRTLLRFLRKIGAVETFTQSTPLAGMKVAPRWRVTSRMKALMDQMQVSEEMPMDVEEKGATLAERIRNAK